ncbi:MAG: TM2 domain-containing protein [Clostridiales bacterium]|nr:TM2 domain-containing protein [Clostridiales bacterium]
MFCQKCGKEIDDAAVVCPGCGVPTSNYHKAEETKEQPQIIINNTNTNTNVNKNINGGMGVNPKNKWVALALCFFLGILGAHKFYEGKILLGVLYFFTGGLCGIGVIIDFITLLFKPNPYYA